MTTEVKFSVSRDGSLVVDFGGIALNKMSDGELLRLSIKKWLTIVELHLAGGPDAVRMDGGIRTCALCQIYFPSCDNCPIRKHTGYPGCRGTPYDDYLAASNFPHRVPRPGIAKLDAAKDEVIFLRGLWDEVAEEE